MRKPISEEAHFIAHYLAKFPDSYELLGIGNNTETHNVICEKLELTESSFRRLRDEYDGFYANRKGFPNPENRKSRVYYKNLYENIDKQNYVEKVIQLLEIDSQAEIERYSDEQNERIPYHEGAQFSVVINKYERNQKAKKECLEHYKRICKICGFKDFETYGNEIGIIEVHHIIPISEINEIYTVDPKQDLIPVCPNCHRALHSQRPPVTIEELKEIINNNR